MIRTAVLLTVYNRKEVTLQGLRSLYKAIEMLEEEYIFDVYMTDDGCTDGTGEAVRIDFPDISIVHGDGNLYWGGGMRLAWQNAIDSGTDYDYFLWFNDDSIIEEDALCTMFKYSNNHSIITGAFKDSKGKASYGGKDINDILIEPNGKLQEIELMNGNMVLIPNCVYRNVGLIDKFYVHFGGDYDYGLRAQEMGYKIYLTPSFVGTSDRHDSFIPKYCSPNLSLMKRWKILHSPIYSPSVKFHFSYVHYGCLCASKYLIISYLGVFSPSVYAYLKKKQWKNNMDKKV